MAARKKTAAIIRDNVFMYLFLLVSFVIERIGRRQVHARETSRGRRPPDGHEIPKPETPLGSAMQAMLLRRYLYFQELALEFPKDHVPAPQLQWPPKAIHLGAP